MPHRASEDKKTMGLMPTIFLWLVVGILFVLALTFVGTLMIIVFLVVAIYAIFNLMFELVFSKKS